MEEEPGRGNGDLTSFYTYEVETLADGKRVLLERPAFLNKGFDMEIHVTDMDFENRKPTMPTHGNMLDDLEEKLAENPEEFEKVKNIIDRLYQCETVTNEEMRALNFKTGYPIEMVLKVIKWMFIEQDVTYWSWSGRNKLYSGIKGLIGDSAPTA